MYPLLEFLWCLKDNHRILSVWQLKCCHLNRREKTQRPLPIRIRDILRLKNLQLSQKHLSKEHCKLFLSSKPFNFLYHTSDFPTSYKGQSRESEKKNHKYLGFLFICHKHLMGGAHKQCPLEKQFPNFKRPHRRKGRKGQKQNV